MHGYPQPPRPDHTAGDGFQQRPTRYPWLEAARREQKRQRMLEGWHSVLPTRLGLLPVSPEEIPVQSRCSSSFADWEEGSSIVFSAMLAASGAGDTPGEAVCLVSPPFN